MDLYVSFECESCENENCTGKGLKSTVYKCSGYKHKQTNADRIRSLTDVELAGWLDYISDSFYLPDGIENWLDWLRQETKEGE